MAKYKVDKDLEREAPAFAQRLTKELNERQMTQAELSAATEGKVSEATISGWLGKGSKGAYTEPRISGLVAVAKALTVSVDYLLGGADCKTADNEAIKKAIGLSDKAIDMLKWLSTPYTEPETLQGIMDKMTKKSKEWDSWILGNSKTLIMGKWLTDEENRIYDEHVQNETNKENLETINLLLSSYGGLEVIGCIAGYRGVKPDDEIEVKSKYPGSTIIYGSEEISGIYAQQTIAAMQDFRNTIRGNVEHGNGKASKK